MLYIIRLVLQLPGANAGKPDIGGAAKDAAKKTPFGYMNIGDLAFDLPGSNVQKSDLPDGPKNLFSSGASNDLPSTSDLPNLPSPPGNADKVCMCTSCYAEGMRLPGCIRAVALQHHEHYAVMTAC